MEYLCTTMNMKRIIFYLFLFLPFTSLAQVKLTGKVVDARNGQPVEFASVLISENGLWAITNESGAFEIKGIERGRAVITIQCMGYQKETYTIDMSADVTGKLFSLKQDNLMLDEVTVVAKRKEDEATTSYTIDRKALDQQQILNISDIETLLPGGKSTNPSLMDDNRIALRSEGQEKGNASFGTAIEIDGVRMDNNPAVDETAGASTRNISVSNIESVEVVTGIPSVEYGDLSNGIVKVNTRKGKSPFIVEGSINQHTHRIAVSKGFLVGKSQGTLNVNFEHARSFSDAASPHTAYQRNILSLNYMKTFMSATTPLTLNIGFTGNIGGYNSESDPDEELDDYTKARDNKFSGHVDVHWLLNKQWITNLSLKASLSYGDRLNTTNTHASSASTQPYIHTMEEGYHIADLGPTGYWSVLRYSDSKPLNWNVRMKGEWNKRLRSDMFSHAMAGVEYYGSRNCGRGVYYGEEWYIPTWRPYRYDELPTMHNLAIYAEEKFTYKNFELTAGLRDDITMISRSAYGTISSLSPRVNGKYVVFRSKEKGERWVTDLSVHAGWGKSVKLPSFQVLYPSPVYSDLLAFASPSTGDNTSFYAYYTHPSMAMYNPDMKWQYTLQTDIGMDMMVKGTHIVLSAFHHKTKHPYMMTNVYSAFAYQYTPPSALDDVTIPLDERIYAVDKETGTITVGSSRLAPPTTLSSMTKRTYLANNQYVNASPINRYGLEWMIDFKQIKALRTSLRFDGNYYYYKGIDETLFADMPASGVTMSDGQPYQYVGYYRGASSTSTGYAADASVANGSLSKRLNLNTTITTHIPKIRMIVALRLEATFYDYHRQLCELSTGSRGVVLADNAQYTGTPYDGTSENQYVAVYPEYYSTWDNPNERIPFAETFLWAQDNDPVLFNDLSKLVVRSNYPYTMNPNRISSYYSANLSVTKEIGDHVSISFYANNFFNNMKTVHSSQTNLDTSLFSSGYIPSYYYGLSVRLKL